MKEQVYIDGNKINDGLPLRSLFYGEGVFETFRYKQKLPVLFKEHLIRMKKGASLLKIPYPLDDYLLSLVRKAVDDSGIDDAYVKICLLSSGDTLFYGESVSSQVLVIIKQYSHSDKSLKLTVNPIRTIANNPLRAIKSMNYLDNIITKRNARESGYDESLYLNEKDLLVECSVSNIFWCREETLYTPSQECGCLPGTTRDLVIGSDMSSLGIDVKVGAFSLNELLASEFIFVTNSLVGCIPVTEIDGSTFISNHDKYKMIKSIIFEKLEWS